MKRCATEAGSFSLSMLYSTAAGVLFVMLFYNLTSYLGATSAVRQAARVAARCLTPTDPECLQVQHQSGGNIQQEWVGYQNASENVSVFVPMFRYEASMLSVRPEVQYDTIELQKGDHDATLTTYTIPQQRYRLRLNQEFVADGVSHAVHQLRYYEPTAPFPQQDRDTSLRPETWLSRQGTIFQPALSEKDVTIRAGAPRGFSTGFISVPELPEALEGVNCFNPDGSLCDNASAAGAATNFESWKTHAYVAIKTFAQVRAQQASTRVRWTNFYIDISAPNEPVKTLCLGGSDWSDRIDRNVTGHNLWLRGPAGATGGSTDNSVCPPRNGKAGNVHDEIAVPRGGAFQIRAELGVEAGLPPAQADVDILYHFNEYRLVEGEVKKCEPYRFTTANTKDSCPSLHACRSDDDDASLDPRKWSLISCDRNYEKTIPLCNGAENALPVEGEIYTTPNTYASCSVDYRPDIADFEAPEGRSICGVELLGPAESVTVLAAPRACENLKDEENLKCGVNTIVGRTPELAECPVAAKLVAEIQNVTAELNAKQPKSAPKFQDRPTVKWQKPEATVWEPHWLADDPALNSVSMNEPSVRKVTRSVQVGDARLVKKNESPTAPGNIDLAQVVKRDGGDIQGNWAAYAARIEQHARVTMREEKVVIDQTFPFTEAVPELYWGQIDSTKAWDFDRDCLQDSYCSTAERYESLEAMLRHYASQQIPQAVDSAYVFNFDPRFEGLQYFPAKTKAEAAALVLPECTPTRTLCEAKLDQATQVNLGIHEEAPASCQDGTYVNCYSRPIGSEIQEADYSETVDEQLAAELGLAELRRIFPFATTATSCDELDSACAAVAIDLDDEGRARVDVHYNMPVVFPLDLILGRNVIPVRYSKEEVLERLFVGWQSNADEPSLN